MQHTHTNRRSARVRTFNFEVGVRCVVSRFVRPVCIVVCAASELNINIQPTRHRAQRQESASHTVRAYCFP